MSSPLHASHPFRIFAITAAITLLALVAVGVLSGPSALFIAIVLILIEVTFSFDNAIINAKVLSTMSRPWQTAFMTIGMLIAVFGMRLVFPILIVMITASLAPGEVVDLAIHHPKAYSAHLVDSHVAIASFGGMFLLMLCLHFFFDPSKNVHWIDIIERPLQRMGRWWTYTLLSIVALLVVSFLPINHAPIETLVAGALGIITYIVVHGLAEIFTKRQSGGTGVRTGIAGFMSFLYLEVLDASFSFDGVIGAFAITQDVILIAIGLGIGALWVRSLTLFMVRRHVLGAYRYLEHGAHYTIGVLAGILFVGLFIHIPEVIAGSVGLVIVGLSIVSSVAEAKLEKTS